MLKHPNYNKIGQSEGNVVLISQEKNLTNQMKFTCLKTRGMINRLDVDFIVSALIMPSVRVELISFVIN